VALTLALGAMAFGLFWLIWILIETVRLGIGGMALTLFTEMTPPPQADSGGLANAIFGSLADGHLATALGHPDRRAGRHLPRRVRAEGLARAARPASSTTSCCRRRPSSSASSSTAAVVGPQPTPSPGWPACWRSR
jgi:hypothetical protein